MSEFDLVTKRVEESLELVRQSENALKTLLMQKVTDRQLTHSYG